MNFLALYEQLRTAGPDVGELTNPPIVFRKSPTVGVASCSIRADDIPQDEVPTESFCFLMDTYRRLERQLNAPYPEAPDEKSAAIGLIRHFAQVMTRLYLQRVLFFILIDRRYRTFGGYAFDAHALLGTGRLPSVIVSLTGLTAVATQRFPQAELSAAVANDLLTLQQSADFFFGTFDIIFDLREIRKCQVGFNRMMQTLWSETASAQAQNLIRRHKTFYRAVENWQANGGTTKDTAAEAVKEMEKRLAELRSSVDANTRTVANMDRRQRSFFDRLKPAKEKIVALFRQAKQDPYAAVTVGEPRRSQLIAVIDYTMTHPIVHDGKSRDEFTLSNAARAVWNMNHRKWELVKGGYETFDALKGACYGLQKKPNDPFRYR